MAGINLSQSLQEKQTQARGKIFDRSFLLTIVAFVLLLGVFGGARWYVSSLEEKMLALDQSISEKTASLRGKEVNRVVDFSQRVEAISKHLATEPDPMLVFRQLELYTLPSVRLMDYQYDRKENEAIVGGLASTLKEVAQQMLALKNMSGVDKITVESIDYDENGKIRFSFNLNQVPPSSGTNAP